MVRSVLRKKRFRFGDERNHFRKDREHSDWLVEHGLFVRAGGGLNEVTGKGRVAADVGLFEV
jgi:hypothetical protein